MTHQACAWTWYGCINIIVSDIGSASMGMHVHVPANVGCVGFRLDRFQTLLPYSLQILVHCSTLYFLVVTLHVFAGTPS